MSVYCYHNRAVSDLAWACFSPPILHTEELSDECQNIANCGLSLSPQRLDWLKRLDRHPAALHDHLNQLRSTRLGIYFESLWHFFLQQDPEVELIAHNLPVRRKKGNAGDGQTVGEFDCLYYCGERQRHFHLELAVKYFLSHRRTTRCQRASHWNEWLGPTSNDRLDQKIDHLTQRQIQLGDHPDAREVLINLGIDTLTKEVEVKGYLFQALNDPLPPPHAFNHARTLCLWMTINELPIYLNSCEGSEYCVLQKPQWLSPSCRETRVEPTQQRELLIASLTGHFLQGNRPQLVAALDASGKELNRFFVTAEAWPAV